MTALLIGWWDQLTPSQRGRRHVLLLAIAVHLFAFLLYSWWYVEDAAISFSYAHNLASGEGLVTVPGGERVEGFSNPTWTLLLALLDLLGISPWIAAKLLGAGLSVGALWLGLRWAETLMGEDAGPWPALAPVALAVSPQLVVWSASGLENPLFTVLLAGGSVALLREAERRGAGIPWSGLLFFLLAVTRPEGAMYGAVAGLVGLAAVGHRGGLRAALSWGLRWGALLAVPLVAWHTWRYAYFAWEFPNTYYAKLWEQKLFAPLDWDGKGWLYLRGYGLVSTVAFLLPVYALGQTGAAGKRRWIALALVGLTFVLMAPTLRFPAELPFYARPDLGDVYPQVVAGVLLALLALLPLAGIGRRGAVARALAWWMCGAAVFFALYSGGDWMKGHRWLSYCVVPMAVLLADGAYALHQALPVGRVQRWAPRAVIATALIASVVHLGLRLGMPETSPYDVKRRVMHMVDVQERLHLDRVSLLEVDMGAHMWWSGFGLVDMAGLVDVPMARSRYDKPYIRTYVYEERDPEFAHVHGGWATRTKLKTHREWSRYLSIPPYPISPWQTHPGAYIRKDLLIRKRWEGERGRRVVFGEDVELTGWQTPAPEVAPGGGLYVELAWKGRKGKTPFRSLLVLSNDERTVAHELPPAYDWLEVGKWRASEQIHGFYTVPLPDDLPPGSYDLAFVVLAEGGGVLAATRAPPGATLDDPRFASGEVRWPAAIEVLPRDAVIATADKAIGSAIARAEAEACLPAEEVWTSARRHLPPHDPWQQDAQRALAGPLARCWARAARDELLRERAVDAIVAARQWDHHDALVLEVGAALAEEWAAAGDAARAEGDDEAALTAYNAAMAADPTRSWTRRAAEEVRRVLSDIESDELRAKAEERKARQKEKAKQRAEKKDGEDGEDEEDSEDNEPVDAPEQDDDAPSGG
jgi:hypothetical protein